MHGVKPGGKFSNSNVPSHEKAIKMTTMVNTFAFTFSYKNLENSLNEKVTLTFVCNVPSYFAFIKGKKVDINYKSGRKERLEAF